MSDITRPLELRTDRPFAAFIRLWTERRTLFRILSFTRPYLKWHLVGILLALLLSSLALVQPWVYRLLIDKVLIEKNTAMLLDVCLAFLTATLLSSLVKMISGVLFSWLGQMTGNDLRALVHRKLMMLSVAYTGRRRTGDLISCFTSDIPVIQGLYTSSLSTLASQVVTFLVVLAVMLQIDAHLTLIAIPSIPVFAVVISLSSVMLKRASADLQQKTAYFTGILQEQLAGLKTSAAFSTGKIESSRFNHSMKEVLSTTVRLTLKSYVFEIGSFLSTVTLILVIWLGGREVIEGSMQVGVLIAYVSYFGMLFGPIGTLAGVSAQVVRALGAAERVFGIIDTEPVVKEKDSAIPLGSISGKIEYRGVSFTYPGGSKVLHGFDVVIEPGEIILMRGESGVGKTTLLSLLLRFWDPDEGEILLDGIPISGVTLESLRRCIGVMFQDSFLYHATVRENILVGRNGASEVEIEAAAHAADAHDFIVELPEGYDTVIGERGSCLSGGQAQRIALARVFLKNPPIVVLDEATSALDSISEERIHASVLRLLEGRTCIVIAHHYSTWLHCTRVIDINRYTGKTCLNMHGLRP